MSQSDTEFDYEAIIQECAKEGLAIQQSTTFRDKLLAQYQEGFLNYKNCKSELNEKRILLDQNKLIVAEFIQKLNCLHELMQDTLEASNSVQNDITKIRLEQQKNSDAFVQNIKNIEDQINSLASEFEEETLTKKINDCNEKLYFSEQNNMELQKEYETLHLTNSEIVIRELPDLKNLIPEHSDLEFLEKELAECKKNISLYEEKIKALQPSFP